MERFSDWLLNELQERKMSQSDLAAGAGLGRGTISNIMSGTRNVGQETLMKIAHALQLPPEFVFEKAGLLPPKPELSAVKRAAIHAIQDAEEDDADFIYKWLTERNEHKKFSSLQPRPKYIHTEGS